ncbi:Methane monooxygenase component C [Azospirillaceae bacterium]
MPSYAVQITTRDQKELLFSCSESETLLDAAARQSIFVPSGCKEGGCGACRATTKKGDAKLAPYSESALPPAARNQGDILLCRAFPQSDLSLSAPFDYAHVQFHSIPKRNADIVSIENIGENTVRLVLRLQEDPERGAAAEFDPGQFMQLLIPETPEKRAYSLSNVPNWDGLLEFLIRLRKGGKFSDFLLHDARNGESLHVVGPQGAFTLQENGLRPRWFVAGGTGIAPMLSMLRRMAEFQEPHEARLYFGVNHESELFALDDLERLKNELPQLKITLCVWKPIEVWNGFTGTPVDALKQDLATATIKPDIYLCGPPILIESCERAALDSGVPATQIISERFLPS